MPAPKNAFTTHHSVHGFTLVELLVVVSIIGVLSTIGVTVFTGARQSANAAKVKADIDAIRKAYEGKYDPISATYAPLSENDFTEGKIPIPPSGGANASYINIGPNASGNPSPTPAGNYAVSFNITTGSGCTGISEPGCYYAVSNQGSVPPDTFSIGNPVPNGSFETDSNGDGLADNWELQNFPNSVATAGSPTPKDGRFAQKVVVLACCYAGIKQTITGLKPSTIYRQTGWMYMESGHGVCSSVGVGMYGSGGETHVGCDRPDQWVQLTLTGSSNALGNYIIGFQNWTTDAYFYVDAVRLEEVTNP